MIPHIFTLVNLALGVFSIVYTVRGEYERAALLVAGSLLADGLDGRIARLVRAAGEFGKELDSLADVVSFGVAPAVLAYFAALEELGPYGLALLAVFPICGALRLARFNIVRVSGYFVGLPITAAGTLLAGLVYYGERAGYTDPRFLQGALLVLAYLMVSTIPYPDFKKLRGARFRVLEWAGPVVLVLVTLRRDPSSLILLPLVTYAFLGPYLYLLRRAGEKVAALRTAGGR